MLNRLVPAIVACLLGATGLAAQQADTVRLSIDDAVSRALNQGDEARLAAAQVELADAQVASARASALPQLRLNGTYTHVIENARAQAVGSIFNQPNTYNVNANVSQSLFQGGRIWSGMRAASRSRGASQANEAETRARTVFDVQRAYLEAALADRLVRIQEANVQLAREQLAQVERFEKSGRSSRYEVLRARVQLGNLEPLAIQARNDRELALLELKRLTNIPMDQPVAVVSQLAPEQVEAIAAEVEASAAAATATGERRGSLRAAEQTVEAREAAIRVARADMLPSLSVFFQTGYQAYPRQNRLPNGFGELVPVPCPEGSPADRICREQNGGFFSDRSLGVQLSWPLFDGLRAKANVDQAQAQARIAALELSREREDVRLEVAAARAGLERARTLHEAQRQSVEEAREAYRLATLRFSRGLSTQLEVTDAQIALMTAEINQARTVHDLHLAAAELARSLGEPIPLPNGVRVHPTDRKLQR